MMLRSFLPVALVVGLAMACSAKPVEPAATPPAGSSLAENSAPAAATPPASATTDAPAHDAPPAKLSFSRDDFDAAVERAKRDGKLVFVDAWAEWCHTCLSMDAVVFSDPSLVGFAAQYEFVAIDTERPQNEAFVGRFQMDTWPTFFVIEPVNLGLVGFWPGAGSVREMREFLEQSLDAAAALQSASLPPYLGHFLAARRAQAQAEDGVAATEYGKAYEGMPADWPRRSEVYLGYIDALSKTRAFRRCAEIGKKHLDEVTGAAKPVQFAQRYFNCLGQLRSADRDAEIERALGKMKTLAESPNADMAFDDRVDALTQLATAYKLMGRKQEAAAAVGKRLALAEEAARRAKDAMEARAFDRVRVLAYLDLGQPEQAIELLERSEREHPHGYATPELLSEVWFRLGRPDDGFAALDRAIANSEGPRLCDYLEEKANHLKRLRRVEAELATVERLVSERAKLRGAAQRQKLEQAKVRLERLRASAKP